MSPIVSVDLTNLATQIHHLELLNGSHTDIQNAESFTVDEVIRHGGSIIVFGDQVSDAEALEILMQAQRDTEA